MKLNEVNIYFFFSEPPKIAFIHPTKEVFYARTRWMPSGMTGVFKKCSDVNPRKRKALSFKELYGDSEPKNMTVLMKNMYLSSCADYKKIDSQLKKLSRIPTVVPVDGECFFTSVLSHINVPKDYTSEHFRKQIAYYASKHWDIFKDVLMPFIVEQSYDSYMKNLFFGFTYGGIVEALIVSEMWNLRISIISPNIPIQHIHHDGSKIDICLLHNGQQGLEGHFSGTSKLNEVKRR